MRASRKLSFAPKMPPQALGVGGFNTGNRLATANGQGPQGSVLGHWVHLIGWCVQAGASATRILFYTHSGSTGHSIQTSGTNTSIKYQGFFSSPGTVSSTALNITASMFGKLISVAYVNDPAANLLRTYYQGVQVATDTATTFLPAASERCVWGTTVTPSSPATDWGITCVQGGDGYVPSADEILTMHRNNTRSMLQGQPIGGIPGKTTWRAQVHHGWNPPGQLKDERGTQDLNVVTGAASGLSLLRTPMVWAP